MRRLAICSEMNARVVSGHGCSRADRIAKRKSALQFAEKYQVRQQNDLRQQVGNPQPGPNLENSLLATESPKMSFSANCLAAAVAAAEAFVHGSTLTARLKACPDTKRVFLRSRMAATTLGFLVPFVTSSACAQRIQFRDITTPAGILFFHNNAAFGQKYLPETMGSGCAFIDYDNDGWP